MKKFVKVVSRIPKELSDPRKDFLFCEVLHLLVASTNIYLIKPMIYNFSVGLFVYCFSSLLLCLLSLPSSHAFFFIL